VCLDSSVYPRDEHVDGWWVEASFAMDVDEKSLTETNGPGPRPTV